MIQYSACFLFCFCRDKKKKKKRLIENEEDEEAGVTNPSMVSTGGGGGVYGSGWGWQSDKWSAFSLLSHHQYSLSDIFFANNCVLYKMLMKYMYLGWRSRGSTASEWRRVVCGGKLSSALFCFTDCYTATWQLWLVATIIVGGSKSYESIAAAAVPSNI